MADELQDHQAQEAARIVRDWMDEPLRGDGSCTDEALKQSASVALAAWQAAIAAEEAARRAYYRACDAVEDRAEQLAGADTTERTLAKYDRRRRFIDSWLDDLANDTERVAAILTAAESIAAEQKLEP